MLLLGNDMKDQRQQCHRVPRAFQRGSPCSMDTTVGGEVGGKLKENDLMDRMREDIVG